MDQDMPGRLSLSRQDRRLIRIMREMRDGELHIIVCGSVPVRVEEIRKNVPLDLDSRQVNDR